MSTIGFKREAELQKVNQSPEVQNLGLNEHLKIRGYDTAIQILYEYLDSAHRPFLKDTARDEFFMQRLRKVKQRFFDPI